MTTADRLSWLIAEVHRGRNAFVSFSFNPSNGKEKVKFTLTSSYTKNQVYRPCLLAALFGMRGAIDSSVSTDKGHTSKSSGDTVVEFWLKQPPSDEPFLTAVAGTRCEFSNATYEERGSLEETCPTDLDMERIEEDMDAPKKLLAAPPAAGCSQDASPLKRSELDFPRLQTRLLRQSQWLSLWIRRLWAQ